MKFVVDRSRWWRGARDTDSALLCEYSQVRPEFRMAEGSMCCLGFMCSAYGVENHEMNNVTSPRLLASEVKTRTKLPVVDWDPFMAVNDDIAISDEVRERKLTELFARVGIEVEFEGEGDPTGAYKARLRRDEEDIGFLHDQDLAP